MNARLLKLLKILVPIILIINVLHYTYYAYTTTTTVPTSHIPVGKKIKIAKEEKKAFDREVAQRFKMIEENKEKYWMVTTGLTETKVDIQVDHFVDTSEKSWLYKNQLFYDPRFTLAVYLHELKGRYLKNKKEPVALPFNWVDWVDLTILNEELSKPLDQRMSCDKIKEMTNEKPNVDYFCASDMNSTLLVDKGFLSRDQFPGFIIHNHCKHDHRTYGDIRVLEGKSYIMTHLPNPSRVILLNKNGGTYEFDVDQNNQKRLISSEMLNNYLSTNQPTNGKVTVDHLKEYKALLKAVKPKTLSLDDDFSGMLNVLQTNGLSTKQLPLKHEMFHYSSSSIRDQISFYETRSPVHIDHLPFMERAYYDSLKYCSKFTPETEDTYFKMATIRIDDDKNVKKEWGWHYDWRFFNGAFNYKREGWTPQEQTDRTNIILDRLLRNWYRFAEEKGIISWIMHGPLLAWYWDGLMFPYDVDIDIQMPISELIRLTKDFNQTLVVEDPTEGYGKYMIDVGTFIHNRGIHKKQNHIDARFVDVDSGIYIDITAVSTSDAKLTDKYKDSKTINVEKTSDEDEVYNDRNKHFYSFEQLSPLKYSMMGGVPLFVPAIITSRLNFEYDKGLGSQKYNDWFFVPRLNLWLLKEQIAPAFYQPDIQGSDGKVDDEKLLKKINTITNSEILYILDKNEDVLIEYYLTKEATDFHAKEKEILFDHLERDVDLDLSEDLTYRYAKLTSKIKMGRPLRKALYDYESIERLKHKAVPKQLSRV